MIFKGHKFRRSTTVYMLPDNLFSGEHKNYVEFGRLCSRETPGAIPRKLLDGGFLYLKKIPLRAHTRTNMAHGMDGRIYLAYQGKCYTAKMKKLEVACEGYTFECLPSTLMNPQTKKIKCQYVANTVRFSHGGAKIHYCARCAEQYDACSDDPAEEARTP